MSLHDDLITMAQAARVASRTLATSGSDLKNQALEKMAEYLVAHTEAIQAANKKDLEAAQAGGISGALLDRLTLTPARISAMAEGLKEIAELPDPIGEVEHEIVRPNGLRIGKMRVPIGVLGMVYEARPNVTADAAGLCLKSGNAVILRGGSEASHSNQEIGKWVAIAIEEVGLPAACVQVVTTTDRQAVKTLLTLDGYIDCVIPRGGKQFLKWVGETATVPVIRHGDGNCHVYADASADLDMAADIIFNAKVQRPGVCNAAETLLVHHDLANKLLPVLLPRLEKAGVELRGCERTQKIYAQVKPASNEDYATEFLDLILAIHVVDDLDAAINHIATYGSGHSEAIVTSDYFNAERFINQVDASSVLINASTRFADGGQYGLGAEIGISTQKLHARGPMGIKELTTMKFIVRGQGQIRK